MSDLIVANQNPYSVEIEAEVEELNIGIDAEVTEEINVTVIQGTDVSDTTAIEGDVLAGKMFHKADGSLATGTLSPSSYVKLAEKEFTVNTTSTSVSIIGSISISPTSDLWTSANYIFITVRDKAGKRAGYFVGADAIFSNASAANGTGTSMSNPARIGYTYSSSNVFAISAGNYGVYPYDINSSGDVRIATRYNSTSSMTVNGTYVVTVWALQFAPNANPFA